MPEIIGLECLCLELVQKADEVALACFDNGCAILPYGVLSIVAAADRIALVLVNIVNAEAASEGLAKDIEPHALQDHGLQVGQRLNARTALPRRIPAQKVEKPGQTTVVPDSPDQDRWMKHRRPTVGQGS